MKHLKSAVLEKNGIRIRDRGIEGISTPGIDRWPSSYLPRTNQYATPNPVWPTLRRRRAVELRESAAFQSLRKPLGGSDLHGCVRVASVGHCFRDPHGTNRPCSETRKLDLRLEVGISKHVTRQGNKNGCFWNWE
ncbi:hypothetical protein HG15A2_08260 [Adhaeretor mobilis]|uniref:Uncharacterized protein n=1 Tax=Adhaeretor mobilis TaxID=1930276 RepID=A0A517MRQ6_9BACT|nr:hypothetical protein HG15A2_08260 [Adhaeretor mobilis]